MNRTFSKLSILFVLSLLVTVWSTVMASAASEKHVDIYDGKGAFITVSNVTGEENIGTSLLLMADPGTKVTFDGASLGRQDINYSTFENTKAGMNGPVEEVKFDVKKYVLYSEDAQMHKNKETIVDSLPKDYFKQYFEEYGYAAGNYATLTKPGFYFVDGASMAGSGTQFVIQIGNPAGAEQMPETVPAVPTAAKVQVNGKEISFEAYNIDGNNYLKLRDLAMAVNGTTKQFEVSWDNAKNAINLLTGKAYTPDGKELAGSAGSAAKEAVPTASKVFADGKEVPFTAYNIDGNNYFKLRDIGNTINFGVAWNGESNSISIDTKSVYTEDTAGPEPIQTTDANGNPMLDRTNRVEKGGIYVKIVYKDAGKTGNIPSFTLEHRTKEGKVISSVQAGSQNFDRDKGAYSLVLDNPGFKLGEEYQLMLTMKDSTIKDLNFVIHYFEGEDYITEKTTLDVNNYMVFKIHSADYYEDIDETVLIRDLVPNHFYPLSGVLNKAK